MAYSQYPAPSKGTAERLRDLTRGLGLRGMKVGDHLDPVIRQAMGIEDADSGSVARGKITAWIEQRVDDFDPESQVIARVAWNVLRVEDVSDSADANVDPAESEQLLADISQRNLKGRSQWLETRRATPRPSERTIQRRTKEIAERLAREIDAVSGSLAPGELPSPDDQLAVAAAALAEHEDATAAFAGRRRRRRWLIAGVLLACGLALGIVALLVLPERRPDVGETRTITTSVLLTSGATEMIESGPPAYLSSATIPMCKAGGCALPETDVHSGAQLSAYCQTEGSRITNGDDSNQADDENPRLFSSTRWYGVQSPDGRTGLISEVWIRPEDRGGLGLPKC